MILTTELSNEVKSAIISNLGWEFPQDESEFLIELRDMTAEEAFECYCTWYGIINFHDMLINALDELRSAETE